MNILVVGGGGREHALVRALSASKKVKKIWCAPGNAGIAAEAECVAVKSDDIPRLLKFAREKKVDLTLVGPESPLVNGLVDHFRRAGLKVVGPTRAAARLEGSKSFAKEFMRKYGIPTARCEVIPNFRKGTYVLTRWPGRSVVKADGLAAGKGVKVCESQAEAKEFLYDVMEKEIFGGAGDTAVIEECLEGQEATVMAFCDGKTLAAMPASQDHKRLLDNDRGPNTGGMGAYAPAPLITPDLQADIEATIFKPFLKGLQAESFDFRGIIYFGLMITPQGPKVLEFNVRFGDPETQVVLPLLESDLTEILLAVAEQRLSGLRIRWSKQTALTVVLAAAGYPAGPERGRTVKGIRGAAKGEGVQVYCAGVGEQKKQWVTAGGRVLAVTGIGSSFKEARDRAYKAVAKISFSGMQYRRDIGAKAMEALSR
ncbi:MAG: phosphoribosylamine--glycine ligase [Elusimicrobia bacterium RIFCSPLOWO2_01_FULL_59_12]|nr:MAG: phosphoribosylamine--glycine ligase [Elusimicrobia bacterium RIFCSPLOWO2_01_FULL_59_12]